MRKIVVVLAVFATLSLAGASPAAAQEPGPVEMEREFVSLINDLRATQGLSALAVHDELVGKARRWSATMAAEGDIWHSDLRDGITVAWRRLGENVGMGGSVRSLHDAFVASPHHYENLVDPGFNYVGLGVVVDPDGTIFVSQEFMELAPAPASASPSPAPSAAATSGGEPGTAASPDLTDPAPAPARQRVRGNTASAVPAAPLPAQAQDDDSHDQASRTEVASDGLQSSLMRPITSTTPAQWLAFAAVLVLATVAALLRSVAVDRVVRVVRGR